MFRSQQALRFWIQLRFPSSDSVLVSVLSPGFCTVLKFWLWWKIFFAHQSDKNKGRKLSKLCFKLRLWCATKHSWNFAPAPGSNIVWSWKPDSKVAPHFFLQSSFLFSFIGYVFLKVLLKENLDEVGLFFSRDLQCWFFRYFHSSTNSWIVWNLILVANSFFAQNPRVIKMRFKTIHGSSAKWDYLKFIDLAEKRKIQKFGFQFFRLCREVDFIWNLW